MLLILLIYIISALSACVCVCERECEMLCDHKFISLGKPCHSFVSSCTLCCRCLVLVFVQSTYRKTSLKCVHIILTILSSGHCLGAEINSQKYMCFVELIEMTCLLNFLFLFWVVCSHMMQSNLHFCYEIRFVSLQYFE